MNKILKYIQPNKKSDFVKYVYETYKVNESELEEDCNLKDYASEFLYGNDVEPEEFKLCAEVKVKKDVPLTQEEQFEKVFNENFAKVDFKRTTDVVWSEAVDSVSFRVFYVVEVKERFMLQKKIVLRDKSASLAFHGFVGNKMLNEKLKK